jgi:hypothetical protein
VLHGNEIGDAISYTLPGPLFFLGKAGCSRFIQLLVPLIHLRSFHHVRRHRRISIRGSLEHDGKQSSKAIRTFRLRARTHLGRSWIFWLRSMYRPRHKTVIAGFVAKLRNVHRVNSSVLLTSLPPSAVHPARRSQGCRNRIRKSFKRSNEFATMDVELNEFFFTPKFTAAPLWLPVK